MKRIALLLLIGFYFVSCNNLVEEPDPDPRTGNGDKTVSLKIHVPATSLSTYADGDATALENGIDSIFISIYQGSSESFLEERKFLKSDFYDMGPLDSIIHVKYEVDNISSTPLKFVVFANKRQPEIIFSEIALPTISTPDHHYFYMSGSAVINDKNTAGTAYEAEIHIERNVAKLRVNVNRYDPIPSDLIIDYENISIKVNNVRSSTTAFGNDPNDAIPYINYPERTGISSASPTYPDTLRPNSLFHNNTMSGTVVIDTGRGGQIDSLYIYENLRTNSGSTNVNATQIEVTIPTISQTDGKKIDSYTYTMYTNSTKYAIKRNYIYTLNINVRGQSLDPLITLDVLPWNDTPIDGSINGTYLDLDKSDISFDENGEIEVNYCTDAQAIYFNFEDFNQANTVNGAVIRGNIQTIGMDTSLVTFPLAPAGFQDAQIIIDQQHCGSFKFILDPNDFPGFPNVEFSGQICIRAGNIVKCLTFPARKSYDAHFIVGEPLFTGETFISAIVSPGASSWMEVSPDRLYTGNATTNFTSAAPGSALFLHLDEFVPSSLTPQPPRTGTITLTTTGGATKMITISQLPAIIVGRYGYSAPTNDNNIYSALLYTEQLFEFNVMPAFAPVGGTAVLPQNALYNGLYTATAASVVDFSKYATAPYFDYHTTVYEAINYCAFKNRTKNGGLDASDIKWYLPAQAQLMAMWTTFDSYKNLSTSNFYRGQYGTAPLSFTDITFMSSTQNTGYLDEFQYVNFEFGNAGHYKNTIQYWARCVRDGGNFHPSMVSLTGTPSYPQIDFTAGASLPSSTYSTTSKTLTVSDHENTSVNDRVFARLQVARNDLNGGALNVWALTLCNSYSEPGFASGWRLPTQRELQAIWILQTEINNVDPTFDLLGDHYYWSGTGALQSLDSGIYTNAWTTFGGRTPLGGAGNSPHQPKSSLYRVRCVRER